jgi:hypothetical protein
MVGPIVLIVLGVLFLLNNLYPGVFRFGRMWPVILIVIGIAKIVEHFQDTNRRKAISGKEDHERPS